MDGSNNNGNFPVGGSGSVGSGRGGRRGHGGEPSFLNPRGDESPPMVERPINENRNETSNYENGLNTNNQGSWWDWTIAQENGRDSEDYRREENRASTSSSSDLEFGSSYERRDDGRDRAANVALFGQQREFAYTAYVSFAAYIRYPSVPGPYGYSGYISGPTQGHVGPAQGLLGPAQSQIGLALSPVGLAQGQFAPLQGQVGPAPRQFVPAQAQNGLTQYLGGPPQGQCGPAQGQGTLAMRRNGYRTPGYDMIPGVCNSNGGNVRRYQVGQVANYAGFQRHRQGFRYGEFFHITNDQRYMYRIRDGSIFYYATTVSYAYERLNGLVLSELLSLRDVHIFSVINSRDYAVSIPQICNDPDLAEAMINHLDCLKALLFRNIQLAIIKQIACINAIMRLVNMPFRMRQAWTLPILHTLTFDLRVVSERIALRGCRGRSIIRYDWVTNNVICYYHPAHCRCHLLKVYRTRNFYRRY